MQILLGAGIPWPPGRRWLHLQWSYSWGEEYVVSTALPGPSRPDEDIGKGEHFGRTHMPAGLPWPMWPKPHGSSLWSRLSKNLHGLVMGTAASQHIPPDVLGPHLKLVEEILQVQSRAAQHLVLLQRNVAKATGMSHSATPERFWLFKQVRWTGVQY